ncbi:unnamed protein product [Chrysoparadoxa australica]
MTQFDYEDFDKRYRDSLGYEIADGFYAIFYSQIVSSSLMIIGHNPGGEPGEIKQQSVKIEEGFHEYVSNAHEDASNRYRLATNMRSYLTRLLNISVDEISSIPKINLVFRRSKDKNSFSKDHNELTMWKAAEHDQEFVQELISTVDPSAIIFEGHEAWKKFCKLYCEPDCSVVWELKAGNDVRLIQLSNPFVKCLGRNIRAVILAHPSRYGTWGAMAEGDEAVRAHLGCKLT